MIAMLQSWGPWQWIDAVVLVSVTGFVIAGLALAGIVIFSRGKS